MVAPTSNTDFSIFKIHTASTVIINWNLCDIFCLWFQFERYFQPQATAVATFYAPIQFPPAPILCYKEVQGKLILVATGSLLSCNPDRLVIKRMVLSGKIALV